MLIVSQDREKVEKMNKYYHCKTQEEYDWLMDRFDKKGYRWNSGRKPKECGNWYKHNINTVIELSDEKLCMCDTLFYKEEENVTDFIDVGELMKKESEENMPTKNVDEFLKKKIFIKVSDDINIELQAGELKIQSQVRENWIKDLRRGLDLIDNVLDYFESETKDA